MKLAENLPVIGNHPKAIKLTMEAVLEDLQELGVSVNIPDSVQGIECYAKIGKESDEYYRVFNAPLRVFHIAECKKIAEQVTFSNGLDELRLKIAYLGYELRGNERNGYVEVYVGHGVSMRFYREAGGLLELKQFVEREEAQVVLLEHACEFADAGITIDTDGNNFKIILQENDPPLTRRLTAENVNKILSIARAWKDLGSQKTN